MCHFRNLKIHFLGICGHVFSPSNPNGIITSPSYPEIYPKDAACIYRITQSNGTYISLKIHDFHLVVYPSWAECHASKIQDFIEIRDGNSSESDLIGKFCGTDIPSTIQSTSNNLWIRLMKKLAIIRKVKYRRSYFADSNQAVVIAEILHPASSSLSQLQKKMTSSEARG